jgi:putative NIF3 family GTP cyclohydrolase 1 type 2
MSWRIAQMLGLENVTVLQPSNDCGAGFGVVGELPEAEGAEVFMRHIMQTFQVQALRHSDLVVSSIRKVAICTGAGASLIDDARRVGADLFLTADLKYNDFMRHENSMILVDMGHFESEYCAIQILFDILSKKIPIFAACKSESSRNPINYMVGGGK